MAKRYLKKRQPNRETQVHEFNTQIGFWKKTPHYTCAKSIVLAAKLFPGKSQSNDYYLAQAQPI